METKGDQDKFLEAYNYHVGWEEKAWQWMGNPKCNVDYLLQLISVKYSGMIGRGLQPEEDSRTYQHQNSLLMDPSFVKSSMYEKLDIDKEFTFFVTSSLRVVYSLALRHLNEFAREETMDEVATFLIGDEEVELEYSAYKMELLPVDQYQALPVHKHKTLDNNGEEFWGEIQSYLKEGTLPLQIRANKEHITFMRCIQCFFIRDWKLWLTQRKGDSNLPCLVVESEGKQQELIALAHNETGH
ncbi:hypothetical protein GYMLUDRAFT_61784 [Collybiopsis luxurians FD-317 M1]|uniref:Uncharacterized protein n=1 Tax=Collybiopsis luxurians FD-317 M1 TaxID=944289 RepID=A0A0D0CN83_9AGAR|nr:hypothetical protein GYMLUDRAFT_61784 [Collybiopsis luxurians FD-317 M1]